MPKKRRIPIPRRPRAPPEADAKLVTHVGSGKYSDVFRVADGGDPAGVMMKVSYYRDSTLCDFLDRFRRGAGAGAARAKRQDSIMVSSAFARLTTHLLDGVSPHFVVVYCDGDCKDFAPRLGALLRERLATLSPMQRRFSAVCFMEPFDANLTQFLLKGRYTEPQLRGLVFQVLYTLAALQALLPGFRHNDLSTNNVLVKRLRAPATAAYRLPDGRAYVVKVPVLVALSDYDFLHVPGSRALSNERVTGGKYRVDAARNASYDVHFFLKSVQKCVEHRYKRSPRALAATRAFLRGLRLRAEDRQNAEIAGLDPLTVLGKTYFAPLAAGAGGPPAGTPTYAFG